MTCPTFPSQEVEDGQPHSAVLCVVFSLKLNTISQKFYNQLGPSFVSRKCQDGDYNY